MRLLAKFSPKKVEMTDEEAELAVFDALDQAKRVGEFNHWRAAKLRKRMKKRFEDKEAEIEAMIFHEKEMVRKKAHRRQMAIAEAKRKKRAEDLEVLEQAKGLGGIMQASCKTWESEEKLRDLELGYTDTIGKMHDRVRGLDEMTHRLTKLRRDIGLEADIKSANKELEDDLDKTEGSPFITCTVCSQDILKTRYPQHCQKCHKRTEVPAKLMVSIKEENMVGVLKQMLTTPCSMCERPVIAEKIARHTEICQNREIARQKQLPSYEAPQAPQAFRLSSQPTEWSIPLAWEPPLFDGGQPIFEYEIQYSFCEKEIVGKKTIRHYVPQTPVLCARWCHKNPIPGFGHSLQHLRAGEEYVDISVRARNTVGWGESSSMIKSVTLKLGSPPTPPLFLRNKTPLVTSCVLHWCSPLRTGGSAIKEYKITYKCIMVDDVGGAGFGGKGEESLQTITIMTGGAELSYNIEGLVTDVEYTDIIVQAVNEDGMCSEPSNAIPALMGAAAGRAEKFRQELNRATISESAWIDSDLFYGFMQRFGKRQYIKLIKFELLDLGDEEFVAKYEIEHPPSDPEDEEEKSSSDSDSDSKSEESNPKLIKGSSIQDDESSIQNTPTKLEIEKYGQFANEHRIRSKHFQVRMHKLQASVDRAKRTREECLARRAEIIFTLRQTEKKVNEIKGELDRSLAFRGAHMDSTVVHGSGHLQRFTTTGLSSVLQKQLNELLVLTTKGKHELIQIENTIKKMDALQAESEDALKDRQAALHQFENELNHRMRQQNEANASMKKGSQKRGAGPPGGADQRVIRRMKVKEVGWVFEQWINFVMVRRHEKEVMRGFLRRATNALLHAGLDQWKLFIKENKLFQQLGPEDGSGGAGSKLLTKVDFLRRSNMTEALNTLRRLRSTRSEVELLASTPVMQKALEQSPFFTAEREMIVESTRPPSSTNQMDKNKRLTSVDKVGIKADYHAELTQGDIYMRQGDYSKAEIWFNKYKDRAVYDDRVTDQCKVWLRLGHLHIATSKFEKAAVSFRNVILLVNESEGALRFKGEAEMGNGKSFHELGKYKVGNDHYMKALTIWMKLNDKSQEIETCKGLVYGYDKVGDVDKAEIYEKRYKSLEWRNVSVCRIEQGKYKLSTMRNTLLGAATMPVDTIRLERVSANVPKMRKKIEEQEILIFETKVQADIKKAQLSGSKRMHERVKNELTRVRKLELDEVDCTLITGSNQRYEKGELLERLKIAEDETYKKRQDEEKEYHRLSILMSNYEDDNQYLHEEINADTGELVQRVSSKKRLRCFALNEANPQTNDVLGGNSGGKPYFLASSDSMVLVFDLLFAKCIAVLNDDPLGHTKTVVSLKYHDNRGYSGGADNIVCVWELDKTKTSTFLTCVGRLEGHTGSVWAIDTDSVKIVTGSTDCCVRIWDIETLECLRVVERPHVRTIMCLKIGPDLIATGGGDQHVKMWELESTFKVPYKHVNLYRRLRGGRYGGHQSPVTCLEFAATELVSGDRLGTILVWNITTGLVLRKLEGSHKHAVRDLRFDATKIISVGNDGLLLLTDISTGEHLQSLHGHRGEIITLAYDSREILTLSMDGDIRHWRFPVTGSEARYKWHLLQPGETLGTLRIKYGHPISKFKEWNNIKDVTADVYTGMRLIVDNAGTGDIFERQRMANLKKQEAKDRELAEMKARLSKEYKQAAKDVDKEFAQQMFAAPVNVSMKQKKKKETKVGGLAEKNEAGEDNIAASDDAASSSDSASSNGDSDSDDNGSSDGSEDENDGSSDGEGD